MRNRLLKLAAFCLATVVALLLAVPLLVPNLTVGSWRMLLNSAIGLSGPPASSQSTARLHSREDFRLELFAADVPKARMLRPTSAGDLLVSQSHLGQILLLRADRDGNGSADGAEVLLADLDRPHGIDIHDDWLFVGESGAIGRIRFDAASGRVSGGYERILEGLPAGGNHWTRTLRVGSDGWIYVQVGSSCNVCEEKHPWRATIIRLRPDGSGAEIFASGLRNSVGFDWAPWDGELYATDNGRDLLGDDYPPCELNRVVRGGSYGWPYVNGFGDLDPDLGSGHEDLLQKAISPVHGFRAHNAPLGISFLRNPGLPEEFRRAALVALHGSWNRSIPDGYKVVLLQWDDDGGITESEFLGGFLRDGEVVGRPVDVVEARDGSIFVSDDYAGAIYRMRYDGRGSGSLPIAGRQAPEAGAQPLAGVPAREIAQSATAGAELMRRYACTSCHAAGTPAGKKLESVGERYDLDTLTEYFLAPTPPMPVFPLSAAARRQLAIALLADTDE
jgi:glucose/arabinose dehydrogenase